jgi:hypothetical protein
MEERAEKNRKNKGNSRSSAYDYDEVIVFGEEDDDFDEEDEEYYEEE